jgi:hypothetical protein
MKRKTQRITPKQRSSAAGVTIADNPDADTRRRLCKYLLSIVEDAKAEPKRRDNMAYCLSKVMASAQFRAAQPPKAQKGPRAPAQPRVSTYVSKKREADAASKTAQKNSPWDGLINGSSHPPSNGHGINDEVDE